jgi:transposase
MDVRDRQVATKMGEGAARREATTVPRGFIVLPRRRVIERTFARILGNCRMSRDDEFLAETTETLIYVAMIRLMVRRMAKGMA